MREKLIELIASKVCDTYSETCEEWLPHDCGKCYANNCHIAEIADHLIANGVTVLPCKIGDTVWAVRYYYGKPVIKQCTVSEMAYLEDMRLAIAVRADRKYSVRGFWNKDIFASYEECVAEVERRDDHVH